MHARFEQQVVWVTGASSGIGEQLAYECARRGAYVILSARNEAELQRVRASCEGPPDHIAVVPLDLTDPADIREKSRVALARWGRIDCLMHNAGMAARGLAAETEMSVVRTVMETNFFGPVALTREVLPSMQQHGRGHLVVVSSLSGKYGVPKLSAYAAAKHALHGYFESLRMEMLNEGIRVTMIVPGFVNTGIIRHSVDATGEVRGTNLAVNEHGMSPHDCAVRILRAVERNKQEALIGRMERWSVYLHRLMPDTYNAIMARHPIKRLRKLLPWMWRT